MKVMLLENKMIDSFTPEYQEVLKKCVGEAPLINIEERIKYIYAACEENLGTVKRLIQQEIPTDIITPPVFTVQKDDFLDTFVVKTRYNQPALEAAVTVAIYRVHKNLKSSHRALDYLMAMGLRPLPVKQYHRIISAADNVSSVKETLNVFENRIDTLKEVVNRAVQEEALVPGTSLFNDLLAHLKQFIMEDKEFRNFIAKAIEMEAEDTLHDVRDKLASLDQKSAE